MLLDVLLTLAPLMVLVPAVASLLTSRVDYRPKVVLQRRLLETLTLAEKLPVTTVGSVQIARDIDRQTLHVAYVAQYPGRAREIRGTALLGAGLAATVVGYYLVLWDDGGRLYELVLLAAIVIATLWLERMVVNFDRNDGLARALFAHFDAPEDLVRPGTELVLAAPALSIETVFARAADVRDAGQVGPMTTLQSVNTVLARAHEHGAWRREARRLIHRAQTTDYRAYAKKSVAQSRSLSATAYDWLMRVLLRPFFTLRLDVLGHTERARVTRAERSGDVYKAAWLHAHYRAERDRVAGHWSRLHGLRGRAANADATFRGLTPAAATTTASAAAAATSSAGTVAAP